MKKRSYDYIRICAVITLMVCPALSSPNGSYRAEGDTKQPNILLIQVDDMNDWVGHLDTYPGVITPNFDRLAAEGVSFTRAYAASPLCGPSRASLCSGRRPSTTSVYDNEQDWRDYVPENESFLSYFKANGYYVGGAGKFHHDKGARFSEWTEYLKRGGDRCKEVEVKGPGKITYGAADCDEEYFNDHLMANWVIDKLGEDHAKPFLITAGFRNPHTPWIVPRKYFDLYPLEDIQLPPHREDDLEDLPRLGKQIAVFEGYHEKMLEMGVWKEQVQAFLATITYVDYEIGRVLDALDASPYKDNTIVVLWSDHGWHMGEKRHWRKRTLWEEATRIPYIWRIPGVTPQGEQSPRTVDLMGMYPSLCELAGLLIPKHVEGVSLKPLLENPTAEWDHPAISTCGYQNHMVRTERWKYIRYNNGGEELYDHDNDPNEFDNLALDPVYASLKTELSMHLPKLNKPRVPEAEFPGCFGCQYRGVGSGPPSP